MFLVAQTALLSATRRRTIVAQQYVSMAAQSRSFCSRLQTHERQLRNKCLQIGSVEKPLDCHVGMSSGGERASTGYDLEAEQPCQDHQTAKYVECWDRIVAETHSSHQIAMKGSSAPLPLISYQ